MRLRIAPSRVKRAEGAALRRSSSEASICGSLTHNKTGSSIFGDLTRLRVPRARWSYRWFTDPRARAGYPVQDHATESRALVADLRAAAVRRDDAQAKDLVRRLLRAIPEIRGPVTSACDGVMRSSRRRIQHPDVGLMELDCQMLVDEERTQILAQVLHPVRAGLPGVIGDAPAALARQLRQHAPQVPGMRTHYEELADGDASVHGTSQATLR
nr:hypothetical protein [Streptomyces glomeratus]